MRKMYIDKTFERMNDALLADQDRFEAVIILKPKLKSYNLEAKNVGYMLKDEHIWHWVNMYEAIKIISFVGYHTNPFGDGCPEYNYIIEDFYVRKWTSGKSPYGNELLYNKIFRQMKEGDSYERLLDLVKNTVIEKHELPKGIDRFITKIESPIIERETNNPNKNTFDFITVECHILKEENCEGNRMEYIRKHKRKINGKVMASIASSKSFRKYGVSVNVLKLYSLMLVKNSLVYKFGIKEIKNET